MSVPGQVKGCQCEGEARVLSVRLSRLITPIVALALVLSGCGLLPSVKDRIYKGMPKVGECWKATHDQASAWMDWQGFDPVSCDEKHTLETVAVEIVQGDYPGTGLGGADEYGDDFMAAANDLCVKSWEKASEGMTKPNRILNFLFYPSPEKFADGERWVRCDVGAFDFGTAWSQDAYKLQVLSLPIAAYSNLEAFRLCLDSPSDDIGASGENLKVIDCGLPHRWTMVRATDMSVSPDEEYPGDEEVNSRARVTCNFKKPKTITGWFWQTPNEGQWKSGDRMSYCWWANVEPAKI